MVDMEVLEEIHHHSGLFVIAFVLSAILSTPLGWFAPSIYLTLAFIAWVVRNITGDIIDRRERKMKANKNN
jgi:hypothetical protein